MASEGQHSREATNTSKLTVSLLNGQNYLSWASSAKLALSGREVLEFITGESKKPKSEKTEATEAETKAARQWQSKNDRVMTWLMQSMEPRISDLFLGHETAFSLWESIKTMYGRQNNNSHIFRLKKEIQQEHQGERSNTEYLGALNKKWHELRVYRPPLSDPIAIQREEEDKIFQYLTGLNPSYEAVKSQLLLTTTLPSFAQITTMVEQEESRRLAMGGPQAGGSEGHETHSFATKNPNFAKNPNLQNHANRPSNKGDRCSYCKKEGHLAEKCYFLHPHLRPKWWDSKGRRQNDRKKKEKEKDRVFSAQSEPTKPYNIGSGSTEPKFNQIRSEAGGSSGSDPMQQLFEQFSVWFSMRNSNNTCGPGNREEDWGRFP